MFWDHASAKSAVAERCCCWLVLLLLLTVFMHVDALNAEVAPSLQRANLELLQRSITVAPAENNVDFFTCETHNNVLFSETINAMHIVHRMLWSRFRFRKHQGSIMAPTVSKCQNRMIHNSPDILH